MSDVSLGQPHADRQPFFNRRTFLRQSLAAGLALPIGVQMAGAATAFAAPAGRVLAQAAPDVNPMTRPPQEAVDIVANMQFPPESSAARAVQAAKKYAGTTLNVPWESGLQAQDPELFTGPLWEKLTGIKINTIEIPGDDLTSKQLTAAHSSDFDVIGISPWGVPDFVANGALRELDGYIQQYMNPLDLDDYLPIYKTVSTYNGKYYGLFDDGDTLLWYYRKDVFADPQMQAGFQAQYGYPLQSPDTYDQFQPFLDAAKYISSAGQANTLYGLGWMNGASWNVSWFQCWFRMFGGQFFDPDTMQPGINSAAAVTTARHMADLVTASAPDTVNWDPVAELSAYSAGQLAMTSFWPPLGRWVENYGQGFQQISFVPPSQVAGRTGYALFPGPGQYTEMANGFLLCVAAGSKNPEVAYLFSQWATSPQISLYRTMEPYGLRDPFRISHINSPMYRNLWPNAGEYLDTIRLAGQRKALLDLIVPGSQEYRDSLGKAMTDIYTGTDPQQALDATAAAWNDVTDRLGRDLQKSAYASFLQLPGSMPTA